MINKQFKFAANIPNSSKDVAFTRHHTNETSVLGIYSKFKHTCKYTHTTKTEQNNSFLLFFKSLSLKLKIIFVSQDFENFHQSGP